MYVCICRAVTEDTVKAAIDAGADTVEAVTGACCAGDDCGSCHQVIEDMIEARTGNRPLPRTGTACAAPRRALPVVRAA